MTTESIWESFSHLEQHFSPEFIVFFFCFHYSVDNMQVFGAIDKGYSFAQVFNMFNYTGLVESCWTQRARALLPFGTAGILSQTSLFVAICLMFCLIAATPTAHLDIPTT